MVLVRCFAGLSVCVGLFPGMGQGQYFGVNLETIRLAVWVAEEHAACCGVNLAFAGFGVILVREWF